MKRNMHVANIGLILRTFAKREEDVPARVEQVTSMLRKAATIRVANQYGRFRAISILVWRDDRYDSDCGMTAQALDEHLRANNYRELRGINIDIEEVRHGDLYCVLLNTGVRSQLQQKCAYSMIASTEAESYLTQENFDEMWKALGAGALVTGLAINELTDSILGGACANTMAIWHNESLIDVGGFDLRAAMPTPDRKVAHPAVIGWDEDKGEVAYRLMGVEEVIPIARLVEFHGECVAPVLPTAEEQRYVVPDPATQRELWERHWKKMGTKTERQTAHLLGIHRDLSFIKGGVMKDYRRAPAF